MKAAIVLVPALLAACAAPPPPQPPPEAPAAPPSAAPSAAGPTIAPARPPSARVDKVEAKNDSVASLRAKIIFENPTKTACRITGYRLDVGAWHKDVKLDGLTIPPGETRDRWLRINPEDKAPLEPPITSGKVTLAVDCDK